MNQETTQAIVVLAIVLPPLSVFLACQIVHSGVFTPFPLFRSTSNKEIHACVTLFGFNRLRYFPGIELIGLALGVNIATIFYNWIDKQMGFVLKPPGFVAVYIANYTGIPTFVILYILIGMELCLIAWIIPRCRSAYETELINTVDRLSAKVPRVIQAIKEGEREKFQKLIKDQTKIARDHLKHQKRSLANLVGFLVLVMALLTIFL